MNNTRGSKPSGLFRKGFHTVDNVLLLTKLESADIRGVHHLWFESLFAKQGLAVALGGGGGSVIYVL